MTAYIVYHNYGDDGIEVDSVWLRGDLAKERASKTCAWLIEKEISTEAVEAISENRWNEPPATVPKTRDEIIKMLTDMKPELEADLIEAMSTEIARKYVLQKLNSDKTVTPDAWKLQNPFDINTGP